MYNYLWDKKTKGYKLTTKIENFVASEIRPVFAEELLILHADNYFDFDANEQKPIMWAKHNTFFYNGEEYAKASIDENNKIILTITADAPKKKLQAVNLNEMIARNKSIMDSLVADSLKRIKEMYDTYSKKCDIVYIGFSGGKDSMVLLDLCHQVLPMSVPVIFSDTNMELPDTYQTWELVQKRYIGRPFIKVKANKSAIENWKLFGPPSQNLRWCCSVHKSTPAILYLRNLAKTPSAKTLAFVGVRADESLRRSSYEDIGDGLKTNNQVNAMPILSWGTHELFLYTFEHGLIINAAYKKGLPRVGCLLCPMSSKRQTSLIHEIYQDAVKPFSNLIKGLIVRDFSSTEDFDKFILTGGWHARQSGVSLKDVILAPGEKKTKNSIDYTFQPIAPTLLLEWLKTLGKVTIIESNQLYELTIKDDIYQIYINNLEKAITSIKFTFEQSKQTKNSAKLIKSCINKALSCVGCQACESECPTGALTFFPSIKINTNKCIHCMKCHATQEGCMRFFSRRYAGGTTMNISGINKYMTFGLKPEWINVLIDEKEQFRSTVVLGNRMIPSAITWFREAKLISDASTVQPTRLLEVASSLGPDGDLLWSLIWIALVNNSPLIKWFICNTPINEKISIDQMHDILSTKVNSESVRKGAIQSLCNTLKNSPISTSTEPLVKLEMKGPRVLSLKRIAKSIDPIAVIYSLYIMADVANRSSFTLSEMMTADFESPFISPLIAFGMSAEELKAQCVGISTVYPQFLSCSFTLGLDEIRVFPEQKTLDDILKVILGE